MPTDQPATAAGLPGNYCKVPGCTEPFAYDHRCERHSDDDDPDTAANEPRVKLVFDLVCTTCLSAVHCDSRHDLLDWLWAHAHEVEVDDPPLDL